MALVTSRTASWNSAASRDGLRAGRRSALDGLAPAVGERAAESAGSACSRSSVSASASGSSGSTSRPLTSCSTSSGMPDTALAITGVPAAIASTSTLGMPSRSSGSRRLGMHSALARRYSWSSSYWPIGPGSSTRSSSPWWAMRPSIAAECLSCWPTIAASKGTPRRRRTAQASTRTSKPFLATWRPTARTRRSPLRAPGGRGVVAAAGEIRVQPVVDEVDLRLGRDRLEVADVRLRAGDDEARGEQLAAQPALRVEVLGVDVAGVAGEAERQAGDPRRVPGDRRRAVGEVRVQVADLGRVDQPVGERDRLQQLLDVDLARAREAGAAVAQRLGAGGGERAGEAAAGAAGRRGGPRAGTARGRRGASGGAAWSATRRRGGAPGAPGWRRRRDGGARARAPRRA